MAILAMDTIDRLSVTSKGHCYALTTICLHMSFVFVIPLKEKSEQHTVHEYHIVILAYVRASYAILLDNGVEFHKKNLIAALDQLGIK